MPEKQYQTRQLIDLDSDQTDSWTFHRMDRHTGLGQDFNLSYHMINSDGKSQSYNSKYAILSLNVLICLSKLLGQSR